MLTNKHYVGQDLTGFADNGKTRPISRVTLMRDDDNGVTAGDDTGMEISATCPYATQEMAEAILAHLKGYQYQMYTADAVNIDPAAELGDGINVNGIYGVISRIADDGGGYPDISGPGEAEMEDEFPVSEGPQMRELKRKVLGQAYSLISKTAEEVRTEVKNDLSGLSASIDVQLGVIDEQVLGLDGRMGEVEITAETVLTRVNGLDDAYAEISTEVGTISATVKDIDGRMTLVEETAEGFTRDIEGLDGRFLKIEERVNGVTYTDDKGRVMINNGSLDLTGAITFSDFDSSTQSAINSKSKTFRAQPAGPYYVGDVWYKEDGTVWRCKKDETQAGKFNASDWEQVTSSGVTKEDVHTFISDDLLAAPTIKGADICGAAYHDINELVDLELTPYSYNGSNSAGLFLKASDDSPIFSVTPRLVLNQYTGRREYFGADLRLKDMQVLSAYVLESSDVSNLIGLGGDYTTVALNADGFFIAKKGITFDFRAANIEYSNAKFMGTTALLGNSTWDSTTGAMYNMFLVVGKPSSSSSLVSVLIPSQQLGNLFQLADDSFYLTFTLNLGGVAINSNPSGGSIVGVYGIK